MKVQESFPTRQEKKIFGKEGRKSPQAWYFFIVRRVVRPRKFIFLLAGCSVLLQLGAVKAGWMAVDKPDKGLRESLSLLAQRCSCLF